MLDYLHPPPFKKFSSCILHRSKLKSCIKTGPTLKGHNILTFDLNLLTQIYFFSSRREHFKTIKHMFFTLVFKKKLVKFNRFLSESFQPLDPCVSSEKSCYLWLRLDPLSLNLCSPSDETTPEFKRLFKVFRTLSEIYGIYINPWRETQIMDLAILKDKLHASSTN